MGKGSHAFEPSNTVPGRGAEQLGNHWAALGLIPFGR